MSLFFRIAVFCALLPCVAISSASVGAQEKTTLVRLSHSSGWDALPAVVALERGLFAQEGLVVSNLPVSNSLAVIQSVSTGSSDFALVPQRTLLVMAAGKLKFGIVSVGSWGAQMELVVPTSDKKTKRLADLKGKRIALTRGSEAFPVLVRLLNRDRLRPSDVKILQMSTSQVTNSIKAKTADAVFDLRYLTSAITQRKEGRVAFSNNDITKAIGRIGATALIVNDRVLQREGKKSKTVQRFVNAWVKALAYIRQDPKDSAVLLRIFLHRQGVKTPKGITEFWLKLARYDRYTWSKPAVTDAEYNGWGLKTGGILKVQPKIAGYVRNEFAKRSMKALQTTAPKSGKKKSKR